MGRTLSKLPGLELGTRVPGPSSMAIQEKLKKREVPTIYNGYIYIIYIYILYILHVCVYEHMLYYIFSIYIYTYGIHGLCKGIGISPEHLKFEVWIPSHLGQDSHGKSFPSRKNTNGLRTGAYPHKSTIMHHKLSPSIFLSDLQSAFRGSYELFDFFGSFAAENIWNVDGIFRCMTVFGVFLHIRCDIYIYMIYTYR